MNKWTSRVEEDKYGDLFLVFPQEMCEQLDWSEGTVLSWVNNKDGTWSIKKVDSDPKKTT